MDANIFSLDIFKHVFIFLASISVTTYIVLKDKNGKIVIHRNKNEVIGIIENENNKSKNNSGEFGLAPIKIPKIKKKKCRKA